MVSEPVLAGAAARENPVPRTHSRSIGTHTFSPQHVFAVHSASPGHSSPLGHLVSPAHAVLPGTQNPPPETSEVQTQSAFSELHGVNVAQVCPSHSGLGFSVQTLSMQTKPSSQSS